MTTRIQPPGPPDRWMVGNLLRIKWNPLRFLEMCAREYGDIVRVCFGPRVLYLVNHPDHVDEVLSNDRKFVKSSSNDDAGGIFGDGLFTSKGEEWLRQRRTLQPAFQGKHISECASIMVECAEQMICAWRDGEVRDLHHDMNLLTLRSVAGALFGLSADNELDQLEPAIKVIVERYRKQFPMPVNPLLLLPKVVPTLANLRLRRATRQIHRIASRILERRTPDVYGRDDLLSILFCARASGTMSDKTLRDEIVTLLLTGHETTACALAWTWYLLACHPAKMAKLNDEVDALSTKKRLTAADLPLLRYTWMVTMESLRLYSPSWGMNRIALEDYRIGGYEVPAGAYIGMSQWVVHRDARYYKEPKAFCPERWSQNLFERLPRGAFFPFGGGRRICIGREFAMLQLVLTLATIARNIEFRLVPGYEVQPQVSITLRPKGGVFATVHLR